MKLVKGGDNCNTPLSSGGGSCATKKSTGGGSCATEKSTGGGSCATKKSTGGGGKHMYNGGNKHSCGTTGGGNKNMYGGKKHGCGTVGGEKHVTGGTYDMKKGGTDCHCGDETKKKGGNEMPDEDKPLTSEEQDEMDKELNIGKINRTDGGKKRKSKRKTKRAKKVKRKTAKKSFLARLFKL